VEFVYALLADEPFRLGEEQIAACTDRVFQERYFRARDGHGKLIPPGGEGPAEPEVPMTAEQVKERFVLVGMALGRTRAFMEKAWGAQRAREGRRKGAAS